MTVIPSQINTLDTLRHLQSLENLWPYLSGRTLQMDTQKEGRSFEVIANLATG